MRRKIIAILLWVLLVLMVLVYVHVTQAAEPRGFQFFGCGDSMEKIAKEFPNNIPQVVQRGGYIHLVYKFSDVLVIFQFADQGMCAVSIGPAVPSSVKEVPKKEF